jgi:hypothetical protein
MLQAMDKFPSQPMGIEIDLSVSINSAGKHQFSSNNFIRQH